MFFQNIIYGAYLAEKVPDNEFDCVKFSLNFYDFRPKSFPILHIDAIGQ